MATSNLLTRPPNRIVRLMFIITKEAQIASMRFVSDRLSLAKLVVSNTLYLISLLSCRVSHVVGDPFGNWESSDMTFARFPRDFTGTAF